MIIRFYRYLKGRFQIKGDMNQDYEPSKEY